MINLSDKISVLTDWNLRPNCLADIYLTQEQQEEVFEWLLSNRMTERRSIINFMRERFLGEKFQDIYNENLFEELLD